jgi:hypothetical protein
MSGARLNVLDFVSLTKWNTKSSELTALKDRLMNPPPDCLYRPFKLVGRDNLLGEQVVMVEAVYQHPVGGPGHDYLWLAPRLGCESMKFRLETQQPDGSYKLIAESKPVSLRLGEPDPSFFLTLHPATDEVKLSEVQKQAFETLQLPLVLTPKANYFDVFVIFQ